MSTELVILVAIIFIIELMAYRLVKRKFHNYKHWKFVARVWLLSTVCLWSFLTLGIRNYEHWSLNFPAIFATFSITFFGNLFPKLIMAPFQILDDIRYLMSLSYKKVTKSKSPVSRASFINTIGTALGAVTLGLYLYGVGWGKYAFRVENIRVPLQNLPAAFKGLRIVQISDAHLGSFVGQPDAVLKALRTINDLKPDMIVFTGDLVNGSSSEAEDWIEVFADLQAPMGKYSIMGNHDYGEYRNFTDEERLVDVKRLEEIHSEMGFKLLLDEHLYLEKGGDRIVLAGVHNWGGHFGKKGDLQKALKGSKSESLTTILMSHDPTHFEQEVMGGKAPIDLTLSGHTHGMQMGIEIDWLGIKYSPVSMLYKRWAGLYKEGEQYLHVNRGFGVLAFRGRVGMPPEITLLELI